ncbi:Paramyosin [Nymphon striatum]|nr:Paramyosin [Nymphon striatum]
MNTTKYTLRTTSMSGGADVNVEYGTDIGALTRLEDKIRLLQDDLESERELRQRIERERSDLTVQLMGYSERLEEAEGSSESQCEMNKKRDQELSKLRKLLEDVHLESEETAHSLRKKHQESVMDLQDTIDGLQKAKNKVDKERLKFQAEVYDLLAQLEGANKEKLHAQKVSEKFEIQVHDYSLKIEEYTRTITDITSQKVRIYNENIEITKECQELKITLDNTNHIKSQLATQLEDTRRRLEDEERKRSLLDTHLRSMEVEMESIKVQLEEESEARLDLERQCSQLNGECATYKSKYETECQAHADSVEEAKRKLITKISEYEEQLEVLLNKCSNLEKQKSRLQSEVEMLIIDLEKANSHAREMEKRCGTLEKLNHDLKNKIEELSQLYETSQRELKQKIQELHKMSLEYEKVRDQRDLLTRENKKLTEDLHETKNQLSDTQRRCHELEIEVKRLENERAELSAAYKEAEAGRKAEEAKCQRLTAEFAALRHEMEKRLHEKDEEIESLRKQMAIEVDRLQCLLMEAEARLKVEVSRLKKKYQLMITELEFNLDAANKQNIDLQKTIKKQGLTIVELQANYDDCHRQLQQALDQLGATQRRCQALQAELDDARVSLDQALRAKRQSEQLYEEAHSKVNELTTININISAAKSKLESEMSALTSDYDEIAKELKMSTDRAQKAQSDLNHTKDMLTEEQERYIKIESIKKSLEIEVRSMQIRIEEIETNALVGGKRALAKLETRIRDVELEFDEEKRKHAETIKVLHKKDRRVKELIIQTEEDHKTIQMFQDTTDKMHEKVKMYKRQVMEQEGVTSTNLQRVRRFQRDLEVAEGRADQAESNLSMIRAKHRSFVTTGTVPGGTKTVYVTESETSY